MKRWKVMMRNVTQKNRDACLIVARKQGVGKEAGRKRRRDVGEKWTQKELFGLQYIF